MQRDDRIFATVGGCVVLVAAAIAAVTWLRSGIIVGPPERATVSVQRLSAGTPSAEPASNSTEFAAEEPASEGDQIVRAAVQRLSSHPVLASWLVNDQLLRRFVSSVDAIAGGYSPRDEVEFLRPHQPFLVQEDEGTLTITSSSYRRYNLVAEVFGSTDTEGVVELYQRFRPQLEEIYAEVAWASSDFDARFCEAVDHLLEVEVPTSPYEVEQRAIAYAFADDHLERLSDAQRQLLRMGPRNARKVQEKLREFRQDLGWPELVVAAPVMMADLQTSPEGEYEFRAELELESANETEKFVADLMAAIGEPSPVGVAPAP